MNRRRIVGGRVLNSLQMPPSPVPLQPNLLKLCLSLADEGKLGLYDAALDAIELTPVRPAPQRARTPHCCPAFTVWQCAIHVMTFLRMSERDSAATVSQRADRGQMPIRNTTVRQRPDLRVLNQTAVTCSSKLPVVPLATASSYNNDYLM
jgi:hypothetical protein